MAASLKQTPLFSLHQAAGARLVDFGGWHMPVSYTGIIDEHKTVRSAVGLFDVSHMGEVGFLGAGAQGAVQRLCTNAVSTLAPGAAMYTVMCYPDGGIVDDCIVYRRGEHDYLMVINAANIDKDWAWIREQVGSRCELVNESDDTGLIAVQGPHAARLVSRLADRPLLDVPSFHFARTQIAGVPCLAARTGYTGEDGFELACPAGQAPKLWSGLLEEGQADGAKPIGLGARDTLRLEARLSLYGNDIDEATSPLEAGLHWVVKPDAGDFIGKAALEQQKAQGTTRKLIGFTVKGRGIARHGYSIFSDTSDDAEALGHVTSGTTSPTLGVAIGMGYVPTDKAKIGAILAADCRGRAVPIEVHKGPFYQRSRA